MNTLFSEHNHPGFREAIYLKGSSPHHRDCLILTVCVCLCLVCPLNLWHWSITTYCDTSNRSISQLQWQSKLRMNTSTLLGGNKRALCWRWNSTKISWNKSVLHFFFTIRYLLFWQISWWFISKWWQNIKLPKSSVTEDWVGWIYYYPVFLNFVLYCVWVQLLVFGNGLPLAVNRFPSWLQITNCYQWNLFSSLFIQTLLNVTHKDL